MPDAPTGAGIPPADAETQPALEMDPDATRLDRPVSPRPLDDSSAGPLSPGQPFGPRYHIVRLLGIGGMGAVYQAWDAELGVVVAVKVIRPEVAADPGAAAMLERRFKQELLLARQVTHKNVVRIYDLGEIDGIKFITMPFIEGEELASIIRRQDEAAHRARHEDRARHRDGPRGCACRGRGASRPEAGQHHGGQGRRSHDHGLRHRPVHRAARLPLQLRSRGPFRPTAWAAGQTMAGAIVGTVQYMAPEQARAEAVDQRADIYAFGLIVYDMLLHKQRARGADTAIAELTSRMQSSPPAARSIDPSIPEPLDRIVAQCIEPDPAKRFQTTPQLVAALNRLDNRGKLLPVVRRLTGRLVAGVLAAFVAVLGLTWWAAQGPPVPVAHEPVSVLIADFQNATGDPTFDGTLEPILKLALEGAGFISAYDRNGIRRSLGVRPPEKLDEQTALALAVKQGVNVVLSGSVERQGSRYAVSVKAVQAVTGNVIASDDATGRRERNRS